ncbi:hypothetical protein BH11BAC5_BH11BAC5_05460 [soil metagenome]
MTIGNILYEVNLLFKIKTYEPCCCRVLFVATVVRSVFIIFCFLMLALWDGINKIEDVVHVSNGGFYKSKICFIMQYKTRSNSLLSRVGRMTIFAMQHLLFYAFFF